MRRLSSPVVVASVVYVVLTAAITWPLVLHMPTVVPNDLGDSLLNMWLMAWNARVLPVTAEWWNAPQFYPVPGATAFSEHLLGLSVITTPIIALTGSPLLAYNAAFFLSFPLCGLAAYFLVYTITRRHDAAFIAGLAYAFAPYRMAQLAHIPVLSTYWAPLVLAALHRYFDDRHARWLVLFAVSWVMQALACGYYLFYLSVLGGLWLVWFAIGKEPWRSIGRVALVWTAAVASLVPVLYGYWTFQRMYGMRRGIDEIRSFSADVASLLKAPENLGVWGWLNVVDRPESALFPGLTVMMLIAAGVAIKSGGASSSQLGRMRAARFALVGAIAIGTVALTPALVGPWKIEVAGVRLLSVSTVNKPLSVAILLLVMAAVLHPAVRALWRRRSPFGFYLFAAIAMWLMSLGPTPTLMNKPLLYMAPYAWLLEVPGADGVRVPARFWMLAVLCLAVAVGLAFRRVTVRWPRSGTALVVCAAVAIVVEAWPASLPLMPAPGSRPNHTDAVARLDLPIDGGSDLVALYRSIEHRRPLFNGYSGYFAPHYWALQYLLEKQGDSAVLGRLAEFGSIEVMVDHDLDPQQAWRRVVGGYAPAELVYVGTDYSSYFIPAVERRSGLPALEGTPLPIAAISAGVNPQLAGEMTDGALISRWHAGRPQSPGDSFTLDLGTVRQVGGIELLIGGYVADFPRDLRIEISTDRQAWNEAWRGPTAALALSAAFEHPLQIPLRFPLEPREARYIRLTQLSTAVYYWSVAELRVMGR